MELMGLNFWRGIYWNCISEIIEWVDYFPEFSDCKSSCSMEDGGTTFWTVPINVLLRSVIYACLQAGTLVIYN